MIHCEVNWSFCVLSAWIEERRSQPSWITWPIWVLFVCKSVGRVELVGIAAKSCLIVAITSSWLLQCKEWRYIFSL